MASPEGRAGQPLRRLDPPLVASYGFFGRPFAPAVRGGSVGSHLLRMGHPTTDRNINAYVLAATIAARPKSFLRARRQWGGDADPGRAFQPRPASDRRWRRSAGAARRRGRR